MQQNKLKLGVPQHEGQLAMNFAKGGPRTGAGRKGLGQTKKVSITLPEETWARFDAECERLDYSKSELLRFLVQAYLSKNE